MKTAYSYIRFSSKRQELGHSLQRQQEAVRAYCTEHNLTLDESLSFEDLGRSGWSGAHLEAEAGLGKFIEACQTGLINSKGERPVLLVENLDRLSRDKVTNALKLFLNILDYVDIVTLSDNKCYTRDSDAMEIVISITYMARAHDESQIKSFRGKKRWENKRELASAGTKKITKHCPFWLTLNEDRETFTIHQDKVDLVSKIFQMSIDGMGQAKIAETLNQEGVLSATGKAWNSSSVRYLLVDKAVMGHYQPHSNVKGKRTPVGDAIEEYYPQVISSEVYYKCVNSRSSRANSGSKKAGRKGKMSNLLQGVAACGACGSPMHYVNKGKLKGHLYLVCASAKRGSGCSYTSYRYEDVWSFVFGEVLKADHWASRRNEQPSTETQNKIDATNGRLAELETNYQAFMEATTNFTSQVVINKMNQFESSIKEVKEELEQLKTEQQTPVTVMKTELLSIAQQCTGDSPEAIQAKINLNQKIQQLLPSGVVLSSTGKREGHSVEIKDYNITHRLVTGKPLGKARTNRNLNDGRKKSAE